MIRVKSTGELEQMRTAGRITAIARKAAADAVRPGLPKFGTSGDS